MDIPLSVRVAIGAGTTAQGRTAGTSTATGAPAPGVARVGGPAPSTAAVDHRGVCTGLDGPFRHSFHPNRSAASGTTTDSPSDGVSLDGTHQQRLRLPADPPPVTRRPA
ncbi:hypothetical protein OHB41_47965 [Streptomyces sp. NBC_01571]|uniref:hypothetical protein n=1 Tax=Streptomyces sp. NBC_01571 TaxID=2975883 RepID=UPI0022558587|nr:hypothetical protein [Streptomyces sp. NBC_01571]MCX4580727.1 hypothetical protein [Streptomyces sp. NBC_01571]